MTRSNSPYGDIDFSPFGNGAKKNQNKRSYTTKHEKDKLLKRQKGKCKKCGKKLTGDLFAVDHIKARALGGSESIDNKQLLCHDCHAIKTREDRDKISKKKKKEKTNNSFDIKKFY